MISTMSRCRSAAVLAGLLTYAQPALAQTQASATDQAREFFEQGAALYRQSRWADAEAQFQKAWDLRKSFDLAANLGDCEIEVGQNREAAEHLAYAVREFPVSERPSLRERLQQRFALARSRVGALKVRVSVPGAEVTVDDRAVGIAPLADEVFVDPGAHTVTARLGEYETGRASVEVAQGGSKEVSVALVKRGATQPVSGGPNVPVIVAGSLVAGVAVAVGGVFLGVAQGKANDAKTQANQMRAGGVTCTSPPAAGACTSLHELTVSSDTFHNAGVPLLAVGGAIGVGTLVYALLPRSKQEQAPPVRVTAAVGPGSAGLWLGGTFR